MGPTDADLLAAHRAGDEHAFGELVSRYRAKMWGIAARTLQHPEDAADAVQEALVSAYRSAGSFRGDASVRTWLHRILVNACIDRIRQERRRGTVPVAEVEPRHQRGDVGAEVVTRLSVERALAALPAPQRVAVVLVDVQGWPLHEVAEILEVPVGTVKSRCARGRVRLAVLLGHLREEER
ncbi:RNA polymerase sigma factor SigM [Pseudonocardia kunmingensis]|uniref:RNA polymerase ECF family sigma subunit n=1 Tax=Pseudonocardia kunmingensis TaxID=630975 RepID=A0A543E3F8_9PSEU|nr:RNA polymerase sigma factor SigM [Pseudonocardia kunmingensis]TQM16128.1 RNA polymerase ECF family sigma subunit [Pseudonocardia kunmingensis]